MGGGPASYHDTRPSGTSVAILIVCILPRSLAPVYARARTLKQSKTAQMKACECCMSSSLAPSRGTASLPTLSPDEATSGFVCDSSKDTHLQTKSAVSTCVH